MSWVIAATVGAAVASFSVGGLVRYRRLKTARVVLRGDPAALALMLKTPGFHFPKIASKPGTDAQQLDANLKAFLVLAELYAESMRDNIFKYAIESKPQTGQTKWATRPEGGPGLLYSATPAWIAMEATTGRALWDKSPANTVERAKWLVRFAIDWGLAREAQGQTIELGDEGQGPTLGELAEDYAQEAAVGYLAAAIPGGAVVLAIAAEFGIGWTSGGGRRDIPKGADIKVDRLLAIGAAEDLIAYAYANP